LDIIPKIAESGAGAMVTKSIGLEPSSGYRNPTIVEVDSGYVNAIGLSNPGIAEFCREVSEIKDKRIPIIVSLFGSKSEDFAVMIKRLEKLDIDCYELNLSCPHVDKVGLEIGQDPKEVSRIVEVSKKYSSKPILVKISPNVTDILGIVAAAEKSGADGITAINTVRAMVIDIETGLPILSNRIGGLSGPAIKPIAIRCVYEISSNFEIPIIGCGGISNWRDVVEFMMAGASAVQIGTAAGLKGLHLFKEILNDLEDYIEKNNYRSIGNIIGLAHSRK
jgi:dihydroorotate dehydrogenase (NAD+) catalytic subunit